jgi:hypothetical protein
LECKFQIVGIDNSMVSSTKIELSSEEAQKAKGIAALIQGAPQVQGRNVAAAAAEAASKLKTSGAMTADELHSEEAEKARGIAALIAAAPQTKGRQMASAGGFAVTSTAATMNALNSKEAQKARGVANLIKNSARSKGRLVAAAAAAAAAASVGFSSVVKNYDEDVRMSVAAAPPPPDEMSIMFAVLMSRVPVEERGDGLTLDMVAEWDQVQEILESGTVDEAALTELFNSVAEESSQGQVIKKQRFREVHSMNSTHVSIQLFN